MYCLPFFAKFREFRSLPLVVAGAVLVSACAQISNLTSGEDMAAPRKMQAAKAEDGKADEDKKMLLTKEKEKEKEERGDDKDYALMKKQLRHDADKAANDPGQSATVTRKYFNTEMGMINERLHANSERVQELSKQVQDLAQRFEHIPSRLAEIETVLKMIEEKTGKAAAEPKAGKDMAKEAAKGAAKNMAKAMAQATEKPFWGIQIGAYKTRAGAEEAWGEFLANPMAIELSDASVRYIPTKPLKNGAVLTLIIVNQYGSEKAAERACNDLKGKGIDCVAMHIKP